MKKITVIAVSSVALFATACATVNGETVRDEATAIKIGKAACDFPNNKVFADDGDYRWRAALYGDEWSVWYGYQKPKPCASISMQVNKQTGKMTNCIVCVA